VTVPEIAMLMPAIMSPQVQYLCVPVTIGDGVKGYTVVTKLQAVFAEELGKTYPGMEL